MSHLWGENVSVSSSINVSTSFYVIIARIVFFKLISKLMGCFEKCMRSFPTYCEMKCFCSFSQIFVKILSLLNNEDVFR